MENDTREQRKAGGVFYTPAFIVEYIVQRTIGVLLQNAEPELPSDAPPFPTILDPACGSGAFLLGAYDYLLDWYAREHEASLPCSPSRELAPGAVGPLRLTAIARQHILLRHIFGVDIDSRAVGATKLALVDRMSAGAPEGTSDHDLAALRRETLERLTENIKCGDALIGADYAGEATRSKCYTEEPPQFSSDSYTHVCHSEPVCQPCHSEPAGEESVPTLSATRPFDWYAEFPKIMRRGGFDAVVGNPPYLSFSGRHAVRIPQPVRQYLRSKYETKGWPASHSFFVEISVKMLSRRFTAFVVPDQVGHLDGYRSMRRMVGSHSSLVEVRYWGEGVFPGAVTPALTFVADKLHQGDASVYQGQCEGKLANAGEGRPWTLRSTAGWNYRMQEALWQKLWANSRSLGDLVADIGIHTGNCARQLLAPAHAADPGCVPLLEGRHVFRYACQPPARALRLDYRVQPGEHFAVRSEARYAEAGYVIRQTASYPIVGPRRHAVYFRNSLLALYPPMDGTDVRYLVAILNSGLMRCVYAQMVQESRQKAFPQVKVSSLRRLPIRCVDLAAPSEKVRHDELVAQVEQMLALHERLSASLADDGQAGVKRQIRLLDGEIDRHVYELYELTPAEIAIVERETRPLPGA